MEANSVISTYPFEYLCSIDEEEKDFKFFDLSDAFLNRQKIYKIQKNIHPLTPIHTIMGSVQYPVVISNTDDIVVFQHYTDTISCLSINITSQNITSTKIANLRPLSFFHLAEHHRDGNCIVVASGMCSPIFNPDNKIFKTKFSLNSKGLDVYLTSAISSVIFSNYMFIASIPALVPCYVLGQKMDLISTECKEESFYNTSIKDKGPRLVRLNYDYQHDCTDNEIIIGCSAIITIKSIVGDILLKHKLLGKGPVKRVQFYDSCDKVMILFRKTVIYYQGTPYSWVEKELSKPCIDGRFMSHEETLIAQIDDVMFQIFRLSEWGKPHEASIQSLTGMSNLTKVRIVELHPNRPLIALHIPNQNKTGIFEIHLDQINDLFATVVDDGMTAADAAGAAATSPSPLASCANEIHNDFEDIDSLKGKCIGRGSHAKVYEVKEKRNEQTVVFKGYPSRPVDDKLLIFQNEADIWRKLDHPNIIKFIGLAQTAKKIGLLLEYLPRNLVQLYKDHELSVFERKKILHGVCTGAQYLHTQSPLVLHRDIRGTNILITTDGLAKLTDLGLSRTLLDMSSEHISVVKHSPHWCAPETWKDLSSTKTDIYSIGMTLFEMTARKKPFDNDTERVIYKQKANGNIPSLPKKDDVFEAFYQRCCATEPNDRYQSAEEARQAVECILIP